MLLISPLDLHSGLLSFDAAIVTNHGAGGVLQTRPLSTDERLAGGMANGIDGQGGNEWPKVQQSVKSLREYLGALPPDTTEDELTNSLFELLT